MEKNWSYKINEPGHPHNGETLWSGRYCAVAAFIFKEDLMGNTFILANKRGKGTPDFQGFWNCPCGFLECTESAEEGCARETKEETGLIISPHKFRFYEVETDPAICNKGHVTLRYIAFVEDAYISAVEDLKGGEENEVEDIKWINIEDLNKYQWAFNHDKIVKEIIDHFTLQH